MKIQLLPTHRRDFFKRRPSAVVELPQLVQESESLSPLVRRRLPRRVCHYFFKGGFKKTQIGVLKAPPAPSASYQSPEPIPRPAAAGLSHGPAVAAAAAAAVAGRCRKWRWCSGSGLSPRRYGGLEAREPHSPRPTCSCTLHT